MRRDVALSRYLERHIEPGLPSAPAVSKVWQHVLVVPAYDEAPELLSTFSRLKAPGKVLVILVLNRPDSNPDPQCNAALREAIGKLDHSDQHTNGKLHLYRIGDCADLFCYDHEQLVGATPAAQGVGLARKIGCDIALLWQSQGAISSEWICSTDADALLPADYFSRLEKIEDSVAAAYPFAHMPSNAENINQATALYEVRLHQYVLGLRYAKSPYAYHTLGSCIAVKGQHYCEVRGYPKRSGGEDFYLLNKLAKLGAVASLNGACIELQSRASHRVPFGTGPAVNNIIEGNKGVKSELFYHPQCFEALRALLFVIDQLQQGELDTLQELLIAQGLCERLSQTATTTLLAMGMAKSVAHCRRHGKSRQQFLRQFHQWFDGFRTLKFIHGIRDNALAAQNLSCAINLQPRLFPASIKDDMEIETIRKTIRHTWKWSVDHDEIDKNNR